MNICMFSGNLTRDCETRTTQNGKTVGSYGMAVSTGWGDKKTTSFLNCVHWNCHNIEQYLKKGTPVIIRGQYQEREYTDKNGNQRKIVEIVVSELDFQHGNKGQNQNQSQNQGPQQQTFAQQQPQSYQPQSAPEYDDYGIPF